MSKEAKKSLKNLLFAGIFILVLVGGAKATLVDANSTIEDGIEYYIQTDKFVYDLGENVEMLYRVTNLRDKDVAIGCSRSGEFNLWVQKDGETIWSLWHWFKWFSPGVELSAGESQEIQHIWDMGDDYDNMVEPRIYNVVGVMYNEPWNYYNHGSYIPTEVGVPITIIPEPSSVALFIFGLPLLRYFNKKKRRANCRKHPHQNLVWPLSADTLGWQFRARTFLFL